MTLLGMVCIPAWAADLRRYDSKRAPLWLENPCRRAVMSRYDSKSRRDQDPLRSGGSSAHHSGITRLSEALPVKPGARPAEGPDDPHARHRALNTGQKTAKAGVRLRRRRVLAARHRIGTRVCNVWAPFVTRWARRLAPGERERNCRMLRARVSRCTPLRLLGTSGLMWPTVEEGMSLLI